MESWFPQRFLRPRGWLLLAAGALAVLLAFVLGRRDLLTVGVFLICLPLLAGAGMHLFRPGFTVRRSFTPAFVETGTTAKVTVEVHGTTPGGGQARLTEELPPQLVQAPVFTYPAPVGPGRLPSRYHYTVRPVRRGLLPVGPLSGLFSDPFDVAFQRRDLDTGSVLTVAPAAVGLPETSLTGGRGLDGSRATRQRANPSDDDVATREYRHGDPLRRVHWPTTARRGELMVRQEESVATPQATLILDRRLEAYGGSAKAPSPSFPLRTSASFEWAVVAAVSIATHLVERGYSLQVLDHSGRPAFRTSRSAPEPSRQSYDGPGGVVAIAQSLAALELSAPVPAGRHRPGLDQKLADNLIQARRRGPVVAITGVLDDSDAGILATVAAVAEGAVALVVENAPAGAEPRLDILRRSGWHAQAVPATASLLEAWAATDGAEPLPVATAGPPARSPRSS